MIRDFRRLYVSLKPREIGFCALEDKCPYLAEKKCRMEYKFIQNCTKELNQELVARGWRRFGAYFSRPICADCDECVGLRIKALEFDFTKSYRRVLAKNARTRVLLRRPNLSNEHLFLHDKYHKFMQQKRGWSPQELSFRQYFNLYVDGAQDFGFELDFYAGEKLVCVDYIDVLADGISSIYCFYDPDFSHLSLGKFSLLMELKLARRRGLPYIYLGYFVAGCKSLVYKADYSPCQMLRHTSTLGESAFLWGKYDSNRAKSTFSEHKH